MEVNHKIILVTGAASGLGAATADFLAKKNATVIFLDRDLDNAKKNAARVNGVALECDVTSEVSVKNAIDTVVSQFQFIHAVVNCAGVVHAAGQRCVIINPASVAAFEGQLGQADYSASKGGIAAMTLPVARELSRFGIRVMTIAPGIMQTPMMSRLSETVQAQLANEVPFPKRLGDPAEFASLVFHIIENSYLNGSVMRLDGALRLK